MPSSLQTEEWLLRKKKTNKQKKLLIFVAKCQWFFFFFFIDFWSISLFVLTFCLKYFCLNFGIGFVCVYFPEMLQFLFHASLRSLSTIVCSSPVPCLFLSLVVSSLFCFFDILLFCFPSLLHFIFPAMFTTSKKPLSLHLVSFHLSHSIHYFDSFSFLFFFAISSWFRWLFLLTLFSC